MTFTRTVYAALAAAVIAGCFTAPAFAQNRFMDQGREAAQRRAENKAVREAEHPETAPAAATASTATPKPAETAPAAQSAPAEPAPAPAPAQ